MRVLIFLIAYLIAALYSMFVFKEVRKQGI